MSKNAKLTVTIDPEILKDLDFVAARTPFKTANLLLAAAGEELGKLRIKQGDEGLPDDKIHNIWHALARITDVSSEETPKRIASGRNALEIAR